ncbi:MAG: aminoacyl-tRNA hydrolase, partial [Acetobacter sp.]
IGHPGAKERVHGWVLGNFTQTDQQDWLDPMLASMADAAPLLADGHADRFMTKVALPQGSKG